MHKPSTEIEPSTARRKIARHRIRHELQRRILDGEWSPGSKLVQKQLAKEFGVSMSLVREAMLELQAWGLVETHDNRGIFVRRWNGDRLLEAYDVREMLEGLASRLCCGHAQESDLRKLEAVAQEIFELASTDRRDEAARLDREFHHRIIQMSGSQMIERLADNYRFIGKFVWIKNEPAVTRNSHLLILQQIRENRPEEAERVARDHVRNGRRLLEQRLAEKAFDPHWVS